MIDQGKGEFHDKAVEATNENISGPHSADNSFALNQQMSDEDFALARELESLSLPRCPMRFLMP